MASEGQRPPGGRFHRFRKLAGMSARLSGDVLVRGVKRLAGFDEGMIGASAAEKLVATLGDLKGAAMKVGQVLSMAPDLLTPEVRAILARLQNQAPSMGPEDVAGVIREELGGAPDELFDEFDPRAMAAASLGQVHRARFRGRLVAVKVQYPGISEALRADVENLGSVVRAIRQATLVLDAREYYDEMRAALMGELDYVREADQCELYRAAARGLPELVAPEIVRERSSRRVLTLELLPGPTLGEAMASPLDAAERFRISRLLIRAVLGPFLAAGVVHADPHPGNYVVLADGRLGILDFGNVKTLSTEVRAAARTLLRTRLRRERIDAVPFCRRVGFRIEPPDGEADELIQSVLEIASEQIRTRDYDFARSSLLLDLRRRIAKNPARALKIRPPPELLLLARATGGLVLNLRQLRGRGDFRAVYEELAALS